MAIGILLVIAVKTRELLGRVGLVVMALGGGLNLSERIGAGYVSDPFSFFGLGYNNMADYLIFFGLVIYGYSYFVRRRVNSRN